jgi:hypothetical protein
MNSSDTRRSSTLRDQVIEALDQFHDVIALGQSPLTSLQSVGAHLAGENGDRAARGRAVQAVLDEAIETLKPAHAPESADPAWRAYRILHFTFREQLPPGRIVDRELHISRAQYYRDRTQAIESVVALLQSWESMAMIDAPQGPVGSREDRWHAALPPATYTRLFGVDAVLDELVDALNDRQRSWLVVIDGMGGSGKTALAREAARRALGGSVLECLVWQTAQQQTFEGREIHATGASSLTVEQVLDGIAAHLALTSPALSTYDRAGDVSAKRREVRAALRHHPCLLVVDNLETAEDTRAIAQLLWALSNPSKALITTRQRIELGSPVRTFHTQSLSREATRAFIHDYVDERGMPAVDDFGVDLITEASGGNPLAIKLVLGQAAYLPLSRVVEKFRAAEGAMLPFYRFLYRRAWSMLDENARTLLVTMPLLAAEGGTWETLAAISGLKETQLDAAIARLVALSLLDVAGGLEKRYTIHPITRHFVLSDIVAPRDGHGAGSTPDDR